MLCASAALAEPPAATPTKTQDDASELVDNQLVAPLKKGERKRSRFSRAAPVAVQRRVRVLDRELLTDLRGKQFVRFAIDERRSRNDKGAWQGDSIVGCAYPGEAEVFVRDGDVYRDASSLLGKDKQEQAGVCRAVGEAATKVAKS
jgi:hypothetical protein